MSRRAASNDAFPTERPEADRRHSCRIRVGPWKMILAADRQTWNRGPGRRFAPDRAVQLVFEFDLQPTASAGFGVDGRTPIGSMVPSYSAGPEHKYNTGAP